MRSGKLFCSLLLLLCLVPVTGTGGALAAGGNGASAVADTSRIAISYFTTYHSWAPVSLDPTDLRRTCFDLLSGQLGARGCRVTPLSEMESHMQRWRVRSGQSLAPGFLAAIASESGAEELLVAHLALFADKVILGARLIDIESGLLVWAGLQEVSIDGSSPAGSDPEERALAAVGEVTRALVKNWLRPSPVRTPDRLVVLPTRGIGVEDPMTGFTLHLLLASVLRAGLWRVTDPGLVVWSLREEGLDPMLLTAAGRAELRRRFGSIPILISELISYDAPVEGREFQDLDRGPVRVTSGMSEPMWLSLLEIDIDSGRALVGQAAYMEAESPAGLFGLERHPPLHRRLEQATNHVIDSYVSWKGTH